MGKGIVSGFLVSLPIGAITTAFFMLGGAGSPPSLYVTAVIVWELLFGFLFLQSILHKPSRFALGTRIVTSLFIGLTHAAAVVVALWAVGDFDIMGTGGREIQYYPVPLTTMGAFLCICFLLRVVFKQKITIKKIFLGLFLAGVSGFVGFGLATFPLIAITFTFYWVAIIPWHMIMTPFLRSLTLEDYSLQREEVRDKRKGNKKSLLVSIIVGIILLASLVTARYYAANYSAIADLPTEPVDSEWRSPSKIEQGVAVRIPIDRRDAGKTFSYAIPFHSNGGIPHVFYAYDLEGERYVAVINVNTKELVFEVETPYVSKRDIYVSEDIAYMRNRDFRGMLDLRTGKLSEGFSEEIFLGEHVVHKNNKLFTFDKNTNEYIDSFVFEGNVRDHFYDSDGGFVYLASREDVYKINVASGDIEKVVELDHWPYGNRLGAEGYIYKNDNNSDIWNFRSYGSDKAVELGEFTGSVEGGDNLYEDGNYWIMQSERDSAVAFGKNSYERLWQTQLEEGAVIWKVDDYSENLLLVEYHINDKWREGLEKKGLTRKGHVFVNKKNGHMSRPFLDVRVSDEYFFEERYCNEEGQERDMCIDLVRYEDISQEPF